MGHIGVPVHLDKGVGHGPLAPGSQGVHAPGAAQHQAIGGAQTGDGDEQVEDIAQHIAENVGKGHGGSRLDQLLVGSAAGDADVIEQIDRHDDEAADGQGTGQVALGVLQLSVDGGGDDPALIGKGSGAHRGEQGMGGGALQLGGGGEVLGQGAAGQAPDHAHHGHQAQGDQLDDGGAGLELACQPGRQGVQRIGEAQVKQGQRHALRPQDAAALVGGDDQRQPGVHRGEEHQRVPGGKPCQRGGERRIINNGGEPAHIITVPGTHGGLGIVHQAVDMLVFLGHEGEGEQAHQHDGAADEPGQDAQGHIAAGAGQNGLCLEKHAGPDDDPHHHADGGE